MALFCKAELLRGWIARKELTVTGTPKVTAKLDAAIGRSCAVSVLYDREVQPLTDRVRLLLCLDGEEYPLGVFSLETVKDSVDDHGRRLLTLTGYDGCRLLQTYTLENGLFLEAGANVVSAVSALVVNAGVPFVAAEPSSLTLAAAREWEPGTDALTAANELLGEINYGSLRFDARGYAVLAPWDALMSAEPSHVLRASDVLRAASRETDGWSKPNVFRVICSASDGALTATAVNDNPLSAFSTVRRGRRIVRSYSVSGAPSQAALQARADRLCAESILTSETVSVKARLTPGIEPGEVIGLEHEAYGGLYRVTGWDMELNAGGVMKLTLQRMILM